MIKTNRSIVVLTPGFPSSEQDSTCLPFQQALVRAIKRKGIKVEVISFQYPYHNSSYEVFGIPVYPFGGKNRGGLYRLWLRKKILQRLDSLFSPGETPGVLSFWYGECAAVGKIFAEKYRLSHYCWILGQDARPGNKYPERLKLPQEKLIALSDFLAEEFLKNYGTKPGHIIPPGIETASINRIEKKDIDLLAVGSLVPLKQFEIFIEILKKIIQKMPGCKAVLIGDGPGKEFLRELASKSDLQSNLQFTGELSHPEVQRFMSRAKILVHPSSYEGFSGVCHEALWAGCHVVSFRKAMNTSIDHWHIVNDQHAMHGKIEQLLLDSRTSYSPNPIFPIDECAEKIMQLFFPE